MRIFPARCDPQFAQPRGAHQRGNTRHRGDHSADKGDVTDVAREIAYIKRQDRRNGTGGHRIISEVTNRLSTSLGFCSEENTSLALSISFTAIGTKFSRIKTG